MTGMPRSRCIPKSCKAIAIYAVAQHAATLLSFEAPHIQKDSQSSLALGIDSTKENEAVYNGLKGDLHSYDVRFFFVGQLIETGEQSVKIGDEFHYWIGTTVSQTSTEFKGVAVVECTTVVSWALPRIDDHEMSVQMAKAEEIMHRYRNALRALANTDR